MSKKTIVPVSLAAGVALAGSLAGVSVAQADASPFAMSELSHGYMMATSHGGEGKCGGDKKGEGKCGDKKGEGKCGEDKKGEGKCGEDKKGEGKCGGDKPDYV